VRENEAECSKRRCCITRDEAKDYSPMLHGLCENLSDEECGANDDFCIWDCHPDENRFQGKTHTRRFRGISVMGGHYEKQQPRLEKGMHETLEECMESGRTIERDDCGVQYEDIMDEGLLREFCLDNHESFHFAKGLHGTDPIIDVADDDSQNVTHNEGQQGTDPETNFSFDNDRRRDVLHPDTRFHLRSSRYRNRYPYRAVLYLEFKKKKRFFPSRCTAFMVSRYWALTAGHCVYGGGDWYRGWKLYKNVDYCSDRTYANLLTVNYAVTFNSYRNAKSQNDKFNWDIAWLRLRKPHNLGYFGFGWRGFSGKVSFHVVSYPADKPNCGKWYQYCRYSEWDGAHQQITYMCDTSKGASGSPVFRRKRRRGYIVYAVHTNGACYNADGHYRNDNHCNLATRITKGKYRTICRYLKKDNRNRC